MPLTEPANQSCGPGMKSSTGDSDWQDCCVWTGTVEHGWSSKPTWLHLKIIPKHIKKKEKAHIEENKMSKLLKHHISASYISFGILLSIFKKKLVHKGVNVWVRHLK